MKSVYLFVAVLATLFAVALATGEREDLAPFCDAGCTPNYELLDKDCNCLYHWIGPHGYYNFWTHSDITLATYHDADHWTPDPALEIVPCKVCFVRITGRTVTFVDQFTHVNDVIVGGNVWDNSIVVLGGSGRPDTQMRIHYDFNPVIFSVSGQRLIGGEILIKIVGKGFGFVAADLTVTAQDDTEDRIEAECFKNADTDSYPGLQETGPIDPPPPPGAVKTAPVNPPCPGRPSVINFLSTDVLPCKNVRIFHRDSHISCVLDLPDANPQELQVKVRVASGKEATRNIFSAFIQ